MHVAWAGAFRERRMESYRRLDGLPDTQPCCRRSSSPDLACVCNFEAGCYLNVWLLPLLHVFRFTWNVHQVLLSMKSTGEGVRLLHLSKQDLESADCHPLVNQDCKSNAATCELFAPLHPFAPCRLADSAHNSADTHVNREHHAGGKGLPAQGRVSGHGRSASAVCGIDSMRLAPPQLPS